MQALQLVRARTVIRIYGIAWLQKPIYFFPFLSETIFPLSCSLNPLVLPLPLTPRTGGMPKANTHLPGRMWGYVCSYRLNFMLTKSELCVTKCASMPFVFLRQLEM